MARWIIRVVGHYRDALCESPLDYRRQSVRAYRRDGESVEALLNEALDFRDLLLRVCAHRPNKLDVNVEIGRSLFHSFLNEGSKLVGDIMIGNANNRFFAFRYMSLDIL